VTDNQTPKWTPGPWKIDPSFRSDHIYTWVIGSDNQPIAGTSGRMRIPDARLIAVAPEMAEVLIEIAEHLYDKQDYDRCRELAKRALAKARGENL
jgi:hypothetical protein